MPSRSAWHSTFPSVARGLEERRNGGGPTPVGGQVRGRGTLDGNGRPAEHRLGLGISPLVLPGEEKGQYYPAVSLHGLGQPLIIVGAVYRGLGVQDVEDHRPGPGPLAKLDNWRVKLPRPGPGNALLLEKIQVGLIHRDHHHVGTGRPDGDTAIEVIKGGEDVLGEQARQGQPHSQAPGQQDDDHPGGGLAAG